MGSPTSGLALAELSPFHAGQEVFFVRDAAEHALVGLTMDPVEHAGINLDYLSRRTADVIMAKSIEERSAAMTILNSRIDETVLALALALEQSTQDLRIRFIQELDNLQTVLGELQFSDAQQADDLQKLRAKVAKFQVAASAWLSL
jgi:hypothetical protein